MTYECPQSWRTIAPGERLTVLIRLDPLWYGFHGTAELRYKCHCRIGSDDAEFLTQHDVEISLPTREELSEEFESTTEPPTEPRIWNVAENVRII